MSLLGETIYHDDKVETLVLHFQVWIPNLLFDSLYLLVNLSMYLLLCLWKKKYNKQFIILLWEFNFLM